MTAAVQLPTHEAVLGKLGSHICQLLRHWVPRPTSESASRMLSGFKLDKSVMSLGRPRDRPLAADLRIAVQLITEVPVTTFKRRKKQTLGAGQRQDPLRDAPQALHLLRIHPPPAVNVSAGTDH